MQKVGKILKKYGIRARKHDMRSRRKSLPTLKLRKFSARENGFPQGMVQEFSNGFGIIGHCGFPTA
jgi:hypothetical protein